MKEIKYKLGTYSSNFNDTSSKLPIKFDKNSMNFLIFESEMFILKIFNKTKNNFS